MFSPAPQCAPDAILGWLAEVYSLEAISIQPLASERDAVFLVQDKAGSRFILKVANPDESIAFLQAQTEMMARVAEVWPSAGQVLPGLDGHRSNEFRDFTGRRCIARLLSYVPGQVMADVTFRSARLLESIGDRLGQINAALADFQAPGLVRPLPWDLQQGRTVVAELRGAIADSEQLAAVDQTLRWYDRYVAPVAAEFPCSAIHNDANPHNWLVQATPTTMTDGVVGLIDYGDAVMSWTIGDLAIALAYLAVDADDLWDTAIPVIRAYHRRRPLCEAEVEGLFGLMMLRLATSVVMAADGLQRAPDNAYLQISQRAILRAWSKLLAIPYRLATAVFRDACGWCPLPQAAEFAAWMSELRPDRAFPLVGFEQATGARLDLSCESPLLADLAWPFSEPSLTQRIEETLADQQADYGIGHYFEPRLLYQSAQFGTTATLPSQRRTIHLGIDLFAPAGTAVCAVADGVVHAVARIDRPLDYGTLVVVRHSWPGRPDFYTLYGHLATFASQEDAVPVAAAASDRGSPLRAPRIGQSIRAGAILGHLGPPIENGGWTPHLHFQILLDDLEDPVGFPGVGHAKLSRVWASLSPNPQPLLDLPACRVPECERPALDLAAQHEQLTRERAARIGGSVRLAYHPPLHLVFGRGVRVFDVWGRPYLDAYNNVPHLGHGHPEIVAAAARQWRLINTNTRYLHQHAVRFAERLASTLPDRLTVCYFLSSASEANELALRLARAAVEDPSRKSLSPAGSARSEEVWVMEAAYHGHTSTLIDCSPYKHAGPGGRGRPAGVHVVELPDIYRGRYRDPQTAGSRYAADVASRIEEASTVGRRPIWLAETCPSVGGQILLPPSYLSQVYAAVRAAGGVCIADEVQTGYGRLGAAFYGFQMHDVVPDIVVLGKPIGNGYPLAAVVTTPEIARAFDNGMEFFSTFGGSTVSCAVGDRVLELTLSEDLQQHAAQVGDFLRREFVRLQTSFAWIGDVRGSGLFWGLDIVTDPSTRQPDPDLAGFIKQRLCDRGILIGTDGPANNVLKIRPPMPFDLADAEALIQSLEVVCREAPVP